LGNTRVEDPRHRVRVEGEQIVYDLDKNTIEVDSRKTFTAGQVKPVTLHVPSFVSQEDQPANPNGIAVITGRKLTIDIRPNTNNIELEGDVHVIDDKFDLRSELLVLETPHDDSFFSESSDKLDRVNYIIAKNNVRATYDTRVLRCGQAEIRPEKDLLLLTGYPVMEALDSGARLSGYSIAMRKQARRVEVESSPATEAERRRVQVSLPPLKTLATQRVENKDTPPLLETTITSDRLVMTEPEENLANFEFTGDILLNGVELEGSCKKMDILADTKKPQGPRNNARQGTSNAALIRSIVTVGDVRLGTKDYIAEGGRAEIFPRIALQEYSTLDDNGMDGREPQFITLSSDPTTPGVRPKLTIRSAPSLNLDDTSTEKKNNSGMGPITIESDFQEIIGGSERSRFFMRGNVLLHGKNLKGECDTVEGIILSKPKTAPGRLAEYSLQKIIGRKNVHITADDNYARGEMLEILPLQDKIYLSGQPKVRSKDGIETMSGDRIVYDSKTKNWEIEQKPADPANQVVQPVIRIPFQKKFNLPDLKTKTNSAN
ncbi:MAG: hypothetical protein LBV12_03450, partial [Puniceicoccales bacterium]|nr:hypothetical protein [Puniceicoccales bacterium]